MTTDGRRARQVADQRWRRMAGGIEGNIEGDPFDALPPISTPVHTEPRICYPRRSRSRSALLLFAFLSLLAGLLMFAAAARGDERVYAIRFRPVPQAAVYVLATRVDGLPWAEQIIGSVVEADGTHRALALVEAPPRSRPDFALRAIAGDGQRSDLSEIVTVQALPTRCDLTDDGTVSSLDAAWLLQVATGQRGACP